MHEQTIQPAVLTWTLGIFSPTALPLCASSHCNTQLKQREVWYWIR